MLLNESSTTSLRSAPLFVSESSSSYGVATPLTSIMQAQPEMDQA